MLHGTGLFVVGVVYSVALFVAGFLFAKRNLTKVLEVTKQVSDTVGSIADTAKKVEDVVKQEVK